MEERARLPLGLAGGIGLVVGGIIFLLGGLLHPHNSGAKNYHSTISSMLSSSEWPAAHWLGIVGTVILLWSVWLLIDDGWTTSSFLAWAGGRLTLIGMSVMIMDYAVELTAHHFESAYAAGQAVAIVDLIEPLQAIGWPAMGIGLGMLALGVPKSAPKFVVGLGLIGSLAMIVGGTVVVAFHVVEASPAFAIIALQCVWMIWAGVRIVRSELAPGTAAGTAHVAPAASGS